MVRTTVYLTDRDLLAKMNAVHVEFFGPPLPARATVAGGLVLPSLRFEIDAVAAVSRR
ncbi:MAG: hypothetical protein F2840_05135 [Actinobacteria bacterium]|uniref:Unannotated protein n=1 Tax=freshwater metagenome TaxID=449393 RepID=A0A6J7JHA3_9ZZZZ|nr:hypothetical protein [Actinomycetota bacterium]